MSTAANDFIERVYNSLFHMSAKKRNKILFDLFGWQGDKEFGFMAENRSVIINMRRKRREDL